MKRRKIILLFVLHVYLIYVYCHSYLIYLVNKIFVERWNISLCNTDIYKHLFLPVSVHLYEGGHDEEVDSPVEDIEGEEQERKNVGGSPVKTQLELGEFGLEMMVRNV